MFKSGFIALIGRPNVGKSTLMNNVLKRKVSIISPKPQTTRNQIQGIYTTDKEQIIFIDTPGIHKPHHQLGDFMNKESLSTLRDVDVIVLVIDATSPFGGGDEFILNELKKVDTPVVLVVNKIDLVKDKNKLFLNIFKFQENFEFKDVYYISALTGEKVDEFLNELSSLLDEGPKYYDEDTITDHPEEFIICELIREKVLMLTNEEVPHSVAVVLEEMKHNDENPDLIDIRATIYVERQSQKKIIIGKGGELIKKVGTLARKEIVMLLGQKVYLELWVKVEENWRNKHSQLKRMGYFTEKD